MSDATQQDADAAVHGLHRWLDVHESRTGRKGRSARKPVIEQLAPLDSEATRWKEMQAGYVKGLLTIGSKYRRKRDLLGALDIYVHLLTVAPDNPEAQKAIKDALGVVSKMKGGKEATEKLHNMLQESATKVEKKGAAVPAAA